MIVTRDADGLVLVRQPDHAAMSERIAARWRQPERFPAGRWPRFLEAVRRHDDGWIEEEVLPSLDPEGRPHDFKTLPVEQHVKLWRRGVDLARRADPYLSLLVAQHARWLYEEFVAGAGAADRERVEGFRAEMDRSIERDREILAAGSAEERACVEPVNLRMARRLLSFFDGLSLRLLGAIRMARTEPLVFGGEEAPLVLQERDGTFRLRPWPFGEPVVRVQVAAARLQSRRFASSEELAAAMSRAPAAQLGFAMGR